VREYWTETRRGLVIEGCPTDIREITDLLELPPEKVIRLSGTRHVIGLWGDDIDTYLSLSVRNVRQTPGQKVLVGV
jgi:hypothetical protein